MEQVNPPQFTANATASAGQHIGGYLIDCLICIPVALIPILGWILVPAYLLTRDALPFLDGQSIGKKLVGIRAVDANGASLSGNWGPALVRNIVLFIPAFPLVELIVLLTNEDTQRLGDQWAKTRVVTVK